MVRENRRHLANTVTGFPAKKSPEEPAENFHTGDVCYQDLGGTFDWSKPIFSQSEALPRSEGCCFISMEFLCLFLGSQLIEKLPWWYREKVCCFLGLVIGQNTVLSHHYLLHQNLQTAASSSSSFHHPLLFV